MGGRLRRAVLVLALAPVASLGLAHAANPSPAITLSVSCGPPGSQDGVTGSGFETGTVSLYWDASAAVPPTASANAGGTFYTTINIPDGAKQGAHTVSARDEGGHEVTRTFTVTAPGSEPGDCSSPTPSPAPVSPVPGSGQPPAGGPPPGIAPAPAAPPPVAATAPPVAQRVVPPAPSPTPSPSPSPSPSASAAAEPALPPPPAADDPTFSPSPSSSLTGHTAIIHPSPAAATFNWPLAVSVGFVGLSLLTGVGAAAVLAVRAVRRRRLQPPPPPPSLLLG